MRGRDREQALDGDGLRFGVFEDAFGAMAPAYARLLHAPDGRVDRAPGRRIGLVDVDSAGADLSGQTQSFGRIASPHAGVQSISGVVGVRDGLLLTAKWMDRDHRPE